MGWRAIKAKNCSRPPNLTTTLQSISVSVRLPSCRGQNCGVQAMIETENHGMSLIRNHRGFLGALFSALLALGLFDPGAASAQEGKQIKLSDKHIQGFMATYEDMAKLYDDANPEPDPKVEAQAEAVAKKNGFKADKSVPEAEKKEGLAQLEAALKT